MAEKVPQTVIASSPAHLARLPPIMTTEAWSNVIERNPIGKGLDEFHASFASACEKQGISGSPDALDQLNEEGAVCSL